MCAYFNISSKSEINSFYKSDFTAQVTLKKTVQGFVWCIQRLWKGGGGRKWPWLATVNDTDGLNNSANEAKKF